VHIKLIAQIKNLENHSVAENVDRLHEILYIPMRLIVVDEKVTQSGM
jgi:hypothetical protein